MWGVQTSQWSDATYQLVCEDTCACCERFPRQTTPRIVILCTKYYKTKCHLHLPSGHKYFTRAHIILHRTLTIGIGRFTGSPVHLFTCRVSLTQVYELLCLVGSAHKEAWSDEKWCCTLKVSVTSINHPVHVWRHQGEWTNPANVKRHTNITPGIVVWGSIGYDFRSPLVMIWLSTTSVAPWVHTSYPFQYPGAVLEQDACPHIFCVYRLHPVELLQWPARSPNLSSIEQMWSQL